MRAYSVDLDAPQRQMAAGVSTDYSRERTEHREWTNAPGCRRWAGTRGAPAEYSRCPVRVRRVRQSVPPPANSKSPWRDLLESQLVVEIRSAGRG
jgi:hypothetical protein